MKLEAILRGKKKSEHGRILRIFKDIAEESSLRLLKQLENRLRKIKERLHHKRGREASLKDKFSAVSVLIEETKALSLDRDCLKILEEWRDEILSMLDKVGCKELEEQHQSLAAICSKINRRTPFVTKILEEFDGDK